MGAVLSFAQSRLEHQRGNISVLGIDTVPGITADQKLLLVIIKQNCEMI